ncbi:bZIP maf transcription factor domain-containing protein [Ditylenchus destructor]|uniref:BZIP maf transcription factor domain-containing protein n=1 Tax=Ditylenchus destructor TaxID=166010 RepID=A0AAD4R6L1_9BILA|nr:bZIP maf transcription factor domain-containing protein [Ditylenchus destructor]
MDRVKVVNSPNFSNNQMSDHGESTENNIQLSGTASETSSAGSPLECGEYEVHGSKLLDDDHLLMGLSVRELNKWLMGQDRATVSAIKQKRRTLKNRGYALNCRARRQQTQAQLEAENRSLRNKLDEKNRLIQQLQTRLRLIEPYPEFTGNIGINSSSSKVTEKINVREPQNPCVAISKSEVHQISDHNEKAQPPTPWRMTDWNSAKQSDPGYSQISTLANKIYAPHLNHNSGYPHWYPSPFPYFHHAHASKSYVHPESDQNGSSSADMSQYGISPPTSSYSSKINLQHQVLQLTREKELVQYVDDLPSPVSMPLPCMSHRFDDRTLMNQDEVAHQSNSNASFFM